MQKTRRRWSLNLRPGRESSLIAELSEFLDYGRWSMHTLLGA